MRLFLPGWEGNSNVKWLRRLELTDGPMMAKEETARSILPHGILAARCDELAGVLVLQNSAKRL